MKKCSVYSQSEKKYPGEREGKCEVGAMRQQGGDWLSRLDGAWAGAGCRAHVQVWPRQESQKDSSAPWMGGREQGMEGEGRGGETWKQVSSRNMVSVGPQRPTSGCGGSPRRPHLVAGISVAAVVMPREGLHRWPLRSRAPGRGLKGAGLYGEYS